MDITIPIIALSYYQYLTQNKFRKYITTKGREYKSKIEDILTEFMLDKEIKTGDCKVSLEFHHHTRRKHDVDNYAKCILDFMSNIVYLDDKQVQELNVKKFYDKENPRIVIRIEDSHIQHT